MVESAVQAITAMVSDALGASMDLAKDAGGLALAGPRFGVDLYLWGVAHVRSFPSLIVKVYNGDEATLTGFTDFCVYASSVIFTVYAAVTALNLVLTLFNTVKEYFSSYLVLPVKIPIINEMLPEPLMSVRNMLQKHVFDRVRALKMNMWIIPLEGHSGPPTLKGATSALAMAVSTCMILSSAPAVHDLMKGGANKASAEALAYTLGTALGLQYLVKLNA